MTPNSVKKIVIQVVITNISLNKTSHVVLQLFYWKSTLFHCTYVSDGVIKSVGFV